VKFSFMAKRLFIVLGFIISFTGKSQCPQIYDYLNNLSSNPYWITCGGGPYTLNFKSNVAWGAYTIDWGDGSPLHVGASYVANSTVPHNYGVANDTFVVTLVIPANSCTMTGVVVIEKPVSSLVTLPVGGSATGCVPANLQFVNSSTDVSKTTKFTWNFGDGSPPAVYSYTNGGQTVSHVYGTGTCQTTVTLTAENYCSMGVPSVSTYSPVQVFDKDVASITPSALVKCWPNNSFTYTNTTVTNCPGSNTFQRQEKWNLGNYWGMGGDSIIDWSPWPPATPVTVAYPAVGSYTLTLMDSSFCGVSTKTLNVNILNPPTSSVTSAPGPFCVNSNVTYTNSSQSGYFYKWDFGDGGGLQTFPFGSVSHTYTTTGTFTVTHVAFLPGGASCSDTDRVVITIVPTPTANFTYTPNFGCNSLNNVNFTDGSSGATGWNWSFGNGNTFSGPTPPAQTYTAIGTHVISLTVTAANSCVNTKTASVTVYQKPIPAFSPTSGCQGAVTSFTDQSISAPTNTVATWKWDFGDGSPLSTLQNPTNVYATAGTYTVKLVISSAFCSDSVSVPITINPKPISLFTVSPTSGCPNLAVTFTNTSVGATSYYWDFGVTPTATSSVTSPTYTYTNPTPATSNNTVTLIAYSSFGCTDTIRKAVSVFGKPIASFTPSPASGCSPLAVTFSNSTLGGAAYNWDFGDGNLGTTFMPTHTYTNTGAGVQNFTVELIVFSANGCKDTVYSTVSVFPAAAGSSFTATPSIGCSPLTVSFTAANGASAYNWDFGNGGTSTLQNPSTVYTNTLPATQMFTAQLIAANSFGCGDTIYNTITVYPQPTADFTMTPSQGCSPLLVNFTNLSTLNASNNWDFNNGAFSTAPDPSQFFVAASATATGVYQVELLVFSADGCRDSIQYPVTVFAKPRPGFVVDTPACSPKVLTFTNTSIGATSYYWDFGNSITSTSVHPTQQYINAGPGNITYTVKLGVSNGTCSDTMSLPISVHPKPVFNSIATPDSGCAPLRVIFPNIPGVVGYNWNFGDGGTAVTGNVTHTFVNTGTASVTYTTQMIGSDIYGCKDTSLLPIKVYPKPVANFSADPTTVITANQQVNLTNLSTGFASSNWAFGDHATSTETNPTHVYNLGGEYNITLIVTSTKGCRDTFDVSVTAIDENVIKVPNAFTPNLNSSNGGVYSPTDLNNDVFHPVIRGVDKDRYELSIYSRWGELLFVTKDINIGWDGYYKGVLCKQDVYIWKINAITVEGVIINKAGDVLLLR
jgi:PKD repeat protein